MGHEGAGKRRRRVTTTRSLSSGAGNNNTSTFMQPGEALPVKSAAPKKDDLKPAAVVKKKTGAESLPGKSRAAKKPVSSKRGDLKSATDLKKKVKKQ